MGFDMACNFVNLVPIASNKLVISGSCLIALLLVWESLKQLTIPAFCESVAHHINSPLNATRSIGDETLNGVVYKDDKGFIVEWDGAACNFSSTATDACIPKYVLPVGDTPSFVFSLNLTDRIIALVLSHQTSHYSLFLFMSIFFRSQQGREPC